MWAPLSWVAIQLETRAWESERIGVSIFTPPICYWVILVDFLILIFFICIMGPIIEASSLLLWGLSEIMHAKCWEENYQEAEPQIAYSGLCTSESVPGWFPIIMNIKSPVLPLPSFLLSVSKDSSKPYMEAQLSMHNSCLSYLNPASNRTVIVQRNYKGNCEYREQTVLQLISITVTELSLLSTSKFNAPFSLRICPSLLLPIVSVVGLSPSALHSSSEWWNCFHSPSISCLCCLLPRSML